MIASINLTKEVDKAQHLFFIKKNSLTKSRIKRKFP